MTYYENLTQPPQAWCWHPQGSSAPGNALTIQTTPVPPIPCQVSKITDVSLRNNWLDPHQIAICASGLALKEFMSEIGK